MNNIKKQFNRKRKKVWIILGFIISFVIVGTSLAIIYSDTASESKRKDKIMNLYNAIFVNKNDKSIDIFPEVKSQAKEILKNLWHEDNIFDKPIYHISSDIISSKSRGFEIYQIIDHSFTKGKNIFKTWDKKIVFIFKNNNLKEINYKKG